MSTHSRPDLFPRSLAALTAQRYEPLEIVVLVNGGHQRSIETLEQCGDPRLRWLVAQPALPMAEAWNRVCAESRGKYFLFCSDDDILVDDAVGKQVDLLEAHPTVGFCHADWVMVDDDDNVVGRWASHRRLFIESRLSAWPKYLVRTGCCMSTAVVRRDLWQLVGGWDADAGHPADNSLYLKLLSRWDEGHVPITTCHYRIRSRKPDTWDQKFEALFEYHRLAQRHLMIAPPGMGSLARTRRRLMARLAREGVVLIASAPTSVERMRVTTWLCEHVISNAILRRLVLMESTLPAAYILARLLAYANAIIRGAKSIVIAIEDAVAPLPSRQQSIAHQPNERC